MADFHPLSVTEIRKTIRDAVVVTLRPETGQAFDFAPGQYLTFRRDFDGQELRRNYSICAGLDEGILQIGIKRVDGGVFSTWANSELRVGDVLQAMPPRGRFRVELSPGNPRHYLGFAGGSGITPILSILKSVLVAEPGSSFTLVYANRALNTVMFREELEDLKNLHMGRLTVIHVLESDAQEIDLFTGRVDAEKCALLFKHWIDIESVDTAFICGPEPMMQAIDGSLRDHGLDHSQIRYELFNAAQPGRARRAAATSGVAAAGSKIAATVIIDGAAHHFDMDPDVTLLEAASRNDLGPPFSCKAGVCASCRARLIEGEVDMATNHALEDYEVERGDILTCQSFPTSGRIVISYDQ